MAQDDIVNSIDSSSFQIGKIYTREDINDFLATIENAGLANPTALTYNRWNCGMPFICTLFEWIERGKYKYLGLGSEYTGACYKVSRERSITRVGTWENGEFEFENQDISSFEAWKSIVCNGNEPIEIEEKSSKKVKEIEIQACDHELCNTYGFSVIGLYKSVNEQPTCNYIVRKSDRLSLVYALVVDTEVKYLGKTIQGYRRPLSYLSYDVMINVKSGIIDTLNENKEVIVLAKIADLILEKDGLSIDICEGYEQALITKFQPEWNNHIQSAP